ncbi:MAG: alpha/beta fold hydrolase [Anaerolineae bacterium]|nr:MAG: alpha/beta fold hydrolase [Anaerolineae bacterium]
MDLDIELYRREVRVSNDPLVRLSAIDLNPGFPRHTFVFLHGYGGDATQWRYQLRHFSHDCRVIALDQRGHGDSNIPGGRYDMPTIQTDLLAALNLLDAKEPVILVGHSFGGAVAAQFAAEHPERVARLVLIATAGEYKLIPLFRFLLNLPEAVLRFAAPFTRGWLGAPPLAMRRWFHHNLKTWNGWSLFRGLQPPTLVLRGARDRVFGARYFEEVARAIPNAEDVNLGASGHMVMLERRDAVNRALESFVDDRERTWRNRDAEIPGGPRGALRQSRPWLKHYDEGVPETICVPNVPLHHLLRSAVRRYPLRWALIYEGLRMTYRRLNQEANRFANLLIARGIQPGDRVMLLLPNLPQLLIAFYGTLKAGAVAVFTLPTNPPDDLVHEVADSGARLLVALNQFSEVARRALDETRLEHVLFTSMADYLPMHKQVALRFKPELRKSLGLDFTPGAKMSLWNRELYRHSPRNPDVNVASQDLAVIQYTGGTTAAPRGVMLTHANLTANALQARHWMPAAQEGKERFLCVIPFAHAYGLTAALNTGVAVGATLVLKPRFEVEDTLKSIQKYHPTIFPGVPHMYVELSNYPGVRKFGVDTINACISGAAPLPVEVQERFEKLTRGRLVEGYGLTEASPITHANPLNGLRKVGSIGVPVPGTEAKIVSLTDSGKEMPQGQIGELAVRGPQVMRGYWNDEAATRRVLTAEGWLLTGDVAQMDEEGYFTIVARKADLWYPARPGEPAFPRDVEEVLFEVPQVKEAAVVAIAGQPIAFIIATKDRPPAEDLIAFCKRRLPPEVVPKLIVFVEEFPRSFIGKVLRRELARYYQQNYADRN